MRKRLRDHPLFVPGIATLVALPILAGLFSLFRSGNSPCKVVQDETRDIVLSPSTYPQSLTYETDVVLVSIGYDQFLGHVKQQLSEHSNFPQGINKWRDTVQAGLRDSNTVALNGGRDRRFIADMLEQGKATVFDKRSQSHASTITVRTYGGVCGPLAGDGHRYFFLPGSDPSDFKSSFWEVRDWIAQGQSHGLVANAFRSGRRVGLHRKSRKLPS